MLCAEFFMHRVSEHSQDQPYLCRCLLQHGKYTEGDAGCAGGTAVLHACDSDQPCVCGCSQQPSLNTQGDFLILKEKKIIAVHDVALLVPTPTKPIEPRACCQMVARVITCHNKTPDSTLIVQKEIHSDVRIKLMAF